MIVLGLFVFSLASLSSGEPVNEWTGHIKGGRESAHEIARELNLVLVGEVIPDSNLFHFKSSGISKRSLDSENLHEKAGVLGVKEFTQQESLSRVKRDGFEERELSVREQCFVSTVGTPSKPSRRCVFPFIFQGKLYQRCTLDESTNGAQWCATSLAGDGTVIQGEWGDCDLDNIQCRVLPPPPSADTTSFADFPDRPQFPTFPDINFQDIPFQPAPRPRLPVRPHKEDLENTEGFLEGSKPLPPARPQRPLNVKPQRLPIGTRILPQGMEEFLLLFSPRKETLRGPRPKVVKEQPPPPSNLDEETSARFTDKEWPRQWYINRGNQLDMNVQEAWDLGYTGKGVTVTILDDGVEWKHPDLMGNYAGEASFDINEEDRDPFPRYDLFDTNKHGTRCAGQVAAMANNSVCTVGIAYNAGIGGVRMLDGTITDAVEARSLSLAHQYIDIYSASWGPDDDGRTVDGPGPLTRQALENGVRTGRQGKGSIFVWASGNGGKFKDNCNCDGYSTSIYTLSVSSASENGIIPWYSEQCSSTLATTYSSGSSSQGERKVVTTDLHGGCTNSHTGTSASSPMAAAITALVLEANPGLSWRDLQHLTVRTTKKANLKANDWRTNGAGYNVSHAFGFGLMDAGAMVKLAKDWTNVPPQKVCEASWQGDVTLPAEEKVALRLPVGEECGTVRVLEHVHVTVSIKTLTRRGALSLLLESPSGTLSQLLAPRPLDNSITGFIGFKTWPLMSTHYWGENPAGNWTLIVRNGGPRFGVIDEWKLILYGTSENHN